MVVFEPAKRSDEKYGLEQTEDYKNRPLSKDAISIQVFASPMLLIVGEGNGVVAKGQVFTGLYLDVAFVTPKNFHGEVLV